MKPRRSSEGSSGLRRIQGRLDRAASLEIWLVILLVFCSLLLANRLGGP